MQSLENSFLSATGLEYEHVTFIPVPKDSKQLSQMDMVSSYVSFIYLFILKCMERIIILVLKTPV